MKRWWTTSLGARQPRNSLFPPAAALGLGLSFPKIPSAGDLASDFPCSTGNNSLLASENSLFRCVGNFGVTS